MAKNMFTTLKQMALHLIHPKVQRFSNSENENPKGGVNGFVVIIIAVVLILAFYLYMLIVEGVTPDVVY